MLFNFLVLLADAPPEGQQPPGWFSWMPIILMALVAWLFLFRPMRKQEAERKAMISRLEKNDRVLTTGGIYGTVVAVSDKEDEVTVRVDDNVRLRMLKSSIMRNLTKEEAARAPKQGAA